MIHCYSEFRAYALIRLSDECVSTKLGVTVNHVLVSLASPFYDLALHLCVLSTILTVLAALLLIKQINIFYSSHLYPFGSPKVAAKVNKRSHVRLSVTYRPIVGPQDTDTLPTAGRQC